MRTDATLDHKQVKLPNSSLMGFSRTVARRGYIVVWKDDYGQRHTARVLCRVAYAPELGSKEQGTYTPAVRNHLMVAVMSDSMSSVYIRWIAPESVVECFSPEDWMERMKKAFNFFTSDAFMKGDSLKLAQKIFSGAL